MATDEICTNSFFSSFNPNSCGDMSFANTTKLLSYDTSAVESYVTENNPKHLNSTINKLKAFYRMKGIDKSNDDIYKQAFKTLPKVASADPSIRKMYANRSFLLR